MSHCAPARKSGSVKRTSTEKTLKPCKDSMRDGERAASGARMENMGSMSSCKRTSSIYSAIEIRQPLSSTERMQATVAVDPQLTFADFSQSRHGEPEVLWIEEAF